MGGLPASSLEIFERHDEPGAEEEEDEERGVVGQVRPHVHTVQGIVLQDSHAVCVCWGGGGGACSRHF